MQRLAHQLRLPPSPVSADLDNGLGELDRLDSCRILDCECKVDCEAIGFAERIGHSSLLSRRSFATRNCSVRSFSDMVPPFRVSYGAESMTRTRM